MAEIISTSDSFATEGERRAAELLKQLPSYWLVICNKVLRTRDGQHSYEIDFTIVGNRWIFLIDEKSWHGTIRGDEEYWKKADGFSERSPLKKIDMAAKVMAGNLSWKVPILKNSGYFVQSGVLLSAVKQRPQIHDPRAAHWIFLPTDICQKLQKLDKQGGNPQIGPSHGLIKTALVGLEKRSLPRRINDYIIHEITNLRPGVLIAQAEREDNAEEKRTLMIYDLGNDPLVIQDLRDFYKREGKALQQLHATGLVPDIKDDFPWSDSLLVLPIVPPSGKSLRAYPLPETREEFVQELLLASTCFKGLDQIHAKGVLHRALGPETIYIQAGSAPKVVFTNFYAARINTASIANTLDELSTEDPYISEDLFISYGFATAQTDTFSLSLVWLERLSGTPISEIRANVENAITLPEQTRWSSFLPIDLSDDLTKLFQAVLLAKTGTQTPSAKEFAEHLRDLANSLRANISVAEPKPLILDNQFKVVRILGQGAMARTYLANYKDYPEIDNFVLKQLLYPEEAYKQTIREYQALQKIKNKYLPRIEDIRPPESDIHIKMEYIQGPTLQQVENEFPWMLERWWSFTQDLLNAVESLERENILHRDIKPANIILHASDNHPVLIDFGFAILQGEISQAAGTPLYLPPEAVKVSQPPLSSDRYATGIILFKALTGLSPFSQAATGRRVLIEPETIVDEHIRPMATILLKAVSPNPDERPVSIGQMRNELQTAMLTIVTPEEAPLEEEQPRRELINSWVQSVRGLYRNSGGGNADNRGLDSDFVRQTYVKTDLDNQLLPAILEQRPNVVFLCGNPGDGKTAFLEQVQQALQTRGAQPNQEKCNLSGWEWIYNGHVFRSCYDASESHEGLSADEQLTEKLQGLEGSSKPVASLTVLVAINDGRLADYFTRNEDHFTWIKRHIEQAKNANTMKDMDVWVIDLKKRSFVNMPDDKERSIFQRVLDSLVAEENWQICEGCAANTVCPIRKNALVLRNNRIQKRLEWLFLLTHMRRQRHITMRDLRSSIAYILSGNKDCEQIHAMRHGEESGSSLVNLAYWQSVFAPAEDNDELLKEMALLDPARFPQPYLDRFLHFHSTMRDAELRQQLFNSQGDLPLQRFSNETAWRAAFKRRLFFEARQLPQDYEDSVLPNVQWKKLLPYQYIPGFIKLLDGRAEPEKVLAKLATGILRSDGIMAEVPKGQMGIVIRNSEEQQLIVLKQLPLTEFELTVQKPQAGDMIETLPEMIILEHRLGTPRLEISLDLFELLMRIADGMQPNAPEFKPLLEDLRLFKDALLLLETRDLVLIENQRRVHYITQRDGKIVRSNLH